MSKYKVGDRVRVLNTHVDTIPNGTEVTIVRIDNSKSFTHYKVKPDYKSQLDEYTYYDADLELVKDMSTEIEVGDIVRINKGFYKAGELSRVINFIEGEPNIQHLRADGSDFPETTYYNANSIYNKLTLVSKTNKGEIVGYELLKDLPGIPAGTKSTEKVDFAAPSNNKGYRFSVGDNHNTFKTSQLSDTTWFKPIYKPKEIVVKISKGRSVTIKDKQVVLHSTESMSFAQVELLHARLSGLGEIKGFSVTLNDFRVQVGCQEFTKEDIQSVYQAIQSLK